jgi:non-specific serine/threonine protein kinase
VAICDGGATRGAEIVAGLDALVAQSLLRAVASEEDARLHLLETVREFAREQLAAQGELEEMRRRHAAHYLRLVEEGEPEERRPRHAAYHHGLGWLDRLERDHDNLRAALGWALGQGEAEIARRLAAGLRDFWYFRGFISEGRALLSAALALPTGGDLALRLDLLDGRGMLALHQGDYPAARADREEALALARQLDDRSRLPRMLTGLGFAARVAEDYATARSALEEGLVLARELGDTHQTAVALHHLGLLALDADDDRDGAWQLIARSLALYREIGYHHGLGAVLASLARVTRARGDALGARALLAEAMAALGDVRDVGVIRQWLSTAASVCADLDQTERAVRLASAAVHLDDLDGSRMWPAVRRERDAWLGPIRRRMGDNEFTRVWAEGQVTTLGQAVADALRPG